MKSYVYGSKKPSSLPTILKLCMSNIAPSPSVGFDVQKKISRTVGVKPDKSEHATRKEKLGTQRCRADCSSVPSPTGALSFQTKSSILGRCKVGDYFMEGQPPWQSDFRGHNELTTFYLEANGLPPGVDLLGPLCSTKAFSLINKLLCCARVVFSHVSCTALHLCAETSCRHPCRQT